MHLQVLRIQASQIHLHALFVQLECLAPQLGWLQVLAQANVQQEHIPLLELHRVLTVQLAILETHQAFYQLLAPASVLQAPTV